MNQYILPLISDRDIKILPSYNLFLSSQKNYIDRKYRQIFLSLGYESRGVKLLKYILGFADVPFLLTLDTNLERYINHVRHIKRDMMNIFDRVGRESHTYSLFFNNKPLPIPEYLLPIEDVGLLARLPLQSDRWEDWKDIRPLRIWSHDSPEFTTNMAFDKVKFIEKSPSYAVSLLCVEALVLKYIVWLTDQKDKEPDQLIVQEIPEFYFLHKYVVSSCIYDLPDIWLLNHIEKLFTIEDKEQLNRYKAENLQTSSQYGRISTNCKKGMESLWGMIQSTRQNVRPDAILSTPLLYSGSINDRIRFVDEELMIPGYSQYEYLRWLRDRSMFRLFTKTIMLRPDLPRAISVRRVLARDCKRVLNRRPWNNCQNVKLKNMIQKDMEDVMYSVL